MVRFGLSHFSSRAAGLWLAAFALLGNIALPAGIAAAADLLHQGGERTALCVAKTSRDVPGKTKPVMLHHCALCAVPAAQPLFAADLALPQEFVRAAQPLSRPVSAIVPLRHGRVQARAPPSSDKLVRTS